MRLDEAKARSLIISLQEELRRQEAAVSNNNVPVHYVGTTEYWSGVQLGDSFDTALRKIRIGATEVELGIYQLNGSSFLFDTRNMMLLNGKVAGLMAVKYFSSSRSGKSIKDEMATMLPFVSKSLLNGLELRLVEEYENASLMGDENFVNALKEGVLRYGYWPSDGSVAPFFQLSYDHDTPDKLMAMVAIFSEEAVEAMT